jgi:hypothetical protein
MTARAITAFGLALALALTACSDDDDEAEPPATTTTATTATPTAIDCVELPGLTTAEITAAAQCTTGDGTIELLGFAFYDCPDGRRLSWNDHGYGYSDGPWQAHARADGQLVPPDADLEACQS